jgi:hypothetical protein
MTRQNDLATLKALFETWDEQDLSEILEETADLDLAISRIAEGRI